MNTPVDPSKQQVWIPRALNGSWVGGIAQSTDEALKMIKAHEPDETKHSGYQILVETMERVLSNSIPGMQRAIRARTVKWDGDGVIPDDAATNPEKYPQVQEVVESGDGIPMRVIYKRGT
jgi:hypothetical protein